MGMVKCVVCLLACLLTLFLEAAKLVFIYEVGVWVAASKVERSWSGRLTRLLGPRPSLLQEPTEWTQPLCACVGWLLQNKNETRYQARVGVARTVPAAVMMMGTLLSCGVSNPGEAWKHTTTKRMEMVSQSLIAWCVVVQLKCIPLQRRSLWPPQ